MGVAKGAWAARLRTCARCRGSRNVWHGTSASRTVSRAGVRPPTKAEPPVKRRPGPKRARGLGGSAPPAPQVLLVASCSQEPAKSPPGHQEKPRNSQGFCRYGLYDRHRGGGLPPTPATPPCIRVRTRRFETVTLTVLEQ